MSTRTSGSVAQQTDNSGLGEVVGAAVGEGGWLCVAGLLPAKQ